MECPAALPAPRRMWHGPRVNRRRHSFACVCLGMIAMLGAVVSFPLSAAHALAMLAAPASGHMMSHDGGTQVGQAQTATAGEDCHKPCPNCPEKGCPDLNACLAKCVQAMAQPAIAADVPVATTLLQVTHRSSLVAAGLLVPPLLRPPRA